jgi:hypothetical protein
MFCAHCAEKITGKPIRQGGEYYCSLECANAASGIATDDSEEYFEEDAIEDFFSDDEK